MRKIFINQSFCPCCVNKAEMSHFNCDQMFSSAKLRSLVYHSDCWVSFHILCNVFSTVVFWHFRNWTCWYFCGDLFVDFVFHLSENSRFHFFILIWYQKPIWMQNIFLPCTYSSLQVALMTCLNYYFRSAMHFKVQVATLKYSENGSMAFCSITAKVKSLFLASTGTFLHL